MLGDSEIELGEIGKDGRVKKMPRTPITETFLAALQDSLRTTLATLTKQYETTESEYLRKVLFDFGSCQILSEAVLAMVFQERIRLNVRQRKII